MFSLTLFSLLFSTQLMAQTQRTLPNRQYRVMPPTSGPQKPVGTFYQEPSKASDLEGKTPDLRPSSSTLPGQKKNQLEMSKSAPNSAISPQSEKIQQLDLASVGKGSPNVFSSEEVEIYKRAAVAMIEETVFLSCEHENKKIDKTERIANLVKSIVAGVQKAKLFKTSDDQPTLSFRWTSTDQARRTEVFVQTKEDQKKISLITLMQQKLKDKVKGPLSAPEVQPEYVSEKTTTCSIEGIKEK